MDKESEKAKLHRSHTRARENVYFKFGSTQYAASFIKTKDNISKYAVVSYKHNVTDTGKFI